jgi:hypothetical protein
VERQSFNLAWGHIGCLGSHFDDGMEYRPILRRAEVRASLSDKLGSLWHRAPLKETGGDAKKLLMKKLTIALHYSKAIRGLHESFLTTEVSQVILHQPLEETQC